MRRNSGGRRSLKPLIISKIFLILVAVYTLYNVFLSQYNIFKTFELRIATQKLETKIKDYRSERERIEKLLELIEKHPEHFKERFAREYMQMQREGEYLLILRD